MAPSADFLTQHAALTHGLGVARLPGRTFLEIRGADRVSFLHAFCTNNIKALAPGQGCEAFITSPQGKTLGHVLVFSDEKRLFLETSAGQAQLLLDHFRRYVLSEDVEFEDQSHNWGAALWAGQKVFWLLDLMSDMLKAQVPLEPPVSCTVCDLGGVPVWVCRTPILGPNCVEIVYGIQPRGESAYLESLMTDGHVTCEPDAVEAARIEAGFPLFGSDITEENLPQEVGRDAQAISFTKGCYLGQETVARIDALGHVNRKLVGLKFSGSEAPPAGTPLLAGGKEVGRVTSAAWSPALNAPLALGYVRTQHARPGNRLESALGAAEVVKLPVTGSPPVG